MMADMHYTKKLAMDAIIRFVDEWTPRAPEPAAPPKGKEGPEGAVDPTGLDRALEKAKEAAKKSEKEEIKGGAGKSEATPSPRGSVGALLEKKAAERREQQRKKEEIKRKGSRGRSRSRKRRKDKKKRGKSSSEKRSASGESKTSESSQGFRQPFMAAFKEQDGAHEPECKHIRQSTVYRKRHSRSESLFHAPARCWTSCAGDSTTKAACAGTSPPSSVFIMKDLCFAFKSSTGVKVLADPRHERNNGIVPKSRK